MEKWSAEAGVKKNQTWPLESSTWGDVTNDVLLSIFLYF